MKVHEFSKSFGHPELHEFSNYWLVYFLVDECGEIVYVGKTSRSGLGKRLLHHSKEKEFASYFYKAGPRSETEALWLEGAFISLLRPKYNKANLSISAEEMAYLSDWIRSGQMPVEIQKKINQQEVEKGVSAMGFFFFLAGSILFIFLFMKGLQNGFLPGAEGVQNTLIGFFVAWVGLVSTASTVRFYKAASRMNKRYI